MKNDKFSMTNSRFSPLKKFLFICTLAIANWSLVISALAGTNAAVTFNTNTWQIGPPGILASNAAALSNALAAIGFTGGAGGPINAVTNNNVGAITLLSNLNVPHVLLPAVNTVNQLYWSDGSRMYDLGDGNLILHGTNEVGVIGLFTCGDFDVISAGTFTIGETNAAVGQVLTATDSSGHVAFSLPRAVSLPSIANQLGITNLIGLGDSIMAGMGSSVTISNGFLGLAATNLGLSFYNLGVGGATIAGNISLDVYNGLYPTPPQNALYPGTAYIVQGGINDAADMPNLDINIFSNILQGLILWNSFLPNPDSSFNTASYNQRITWSDLWHQGSYFGSVNGGYSTAHWNSGAATEYTGDYSTNQTDSIVLTSGFGSTVIIWSDIWTNLWTNNTGFSIHPGTNVVYVDGVSNCLIPCYVTNICNPFNGNAFIATVITGLANTNHVVAISNLTGCVAGYSGTMTAMSFAGAAFPAEVQNLNPTYLMDTTFSVSTSPVYSHAACMQQNAAKQGIVTFLKSIGIPIAYVSTCGILQSYNCLSSDLTHPNNLGYTNMAVQLENSLLNNMAWNGVSPAR